MSTRRLIRGLRGTDSEPINALSKTILDLQGVQPKPRRKKLGSKRHHTGLRIDIVSERLCDDVIRYLSPTLEKHKGCTLLDLHPGACLFSSKLHDYLKPKHHLLMEPDEKYFEPFIKPLLDRPNSTFRYSNLSFADPAGYAQNYEALERDSSLLPIRQDIQVGDPRRREPDHSVLLIGNLAKRYGYWGMSTTVDPVPLILHQIGYGSLANEFFQKAGLVRMLWWIPERYKHLISARQMYWRTALNVGLDMGLDISEVAGVNSARSLIESQTRNWTVRQRTGLLENMNNRDVADRMRKDGFIVPEGREIHQPPESQVDFSPSRYRPAQEVMAQVLQKKGIDSENLSPLANTVSAAALEAKIDTASARLENVSSWITIRSTKGMASKFEDALADIEYPQTIHIVKDGHITTRTRPESTVIFLDISFRLLNFEANLKELEEKQSAADPTQLNRAREKILALDGALYKLLEAMPTRMLEIVAERTEDQLAFFSSPPLMTWDRRPYEPLQAESTEFYPRNDLALFDMVPKSRDLTVPGLADSVECSNFCAELLKMLFTAQSQPLPATLDKVAVNAGKDLIPMVSAITDPRKGGRLNPNHLKVRQLTEEMAEGLVKAFFEWPFRPQSWELALANEKRGVGPDDSAGDGAAEAEH